MRKIFCLTGIVIFIGIGCSKIDNKISSPIQEKQGDSLGKKDKKCISNSTFQIKDFVFLQAKTYSCGGQTHKVNEYRHLKTGMEFVFIPTGQYYVKGETHKSAMISLSWYLISKTEVTQKVWKQIMQTVPWKKVKNIKTGSNYPVANITWFDAVKFCQKTNLRLPTEVEWEVACRAGTKTKYYWGNSESRVGDYSWYRDNTMDLDKDFPHEVGKKKPNAFGLYDMMGNVWEWCWDLGQDSFYPSGNNNPKGAKYGDCRIYRGGGNDSVLEEFNSSARGGNHPDYKGSTIGFRVVYSGSFEGGNK